MCTTVEGEAVGTSGPVFREQAEKRRESESTLRPFHVMNNYDWERRGILSTAQQRWRSHFRRLESRLFNDLVCSIRSSTGEASPHALSAILEANDTWASIQEWYRHRLFESCMKDAAITFNHLAEHRPSCLHSKHRIIDCKWWYCKRFATQTAFEGKWIRFRRASTKRGCSNRWYIRGRVEVRNCTSCVDNLLGTELGRSRRRSNRTSRVPAKRSWVRIQRVASGSSIKGGWTRQCQRNINDRDQGTEVSVGNSSGLWVSNFDPIL